MANLRELAQAQFPFRDRPMNVFRIRDWWGLVLGVAVLALITSLAQPVLQVLRGRLAGVPVIGEHVGVEKVEDVEPQIRILK